VVGGNRERYAFGESHLAALRLAKVAEIFDPTSRAFLTDFAEGELDLALDLGCGPGYTTHLVARALRPRRTIGLDRSSSFLELARPSATESISFIKHDVTTVPFPTGPADLIYCRFLLTHLANPGSQLAKWATQLRSGGLLLIDEVEKIHTKNPVFRAYLEIVAAMLDHQGNRLYVGPFLDAMHDVTGLRRRSSRVATLAPTARQASVMFLMNLRVWCQDQFIKSSYPDETINGLESDLATLGESEVPARIAWSLRQIVYQRT
jgi:trans-aconitate 2-methyltransferase